jgi:oxygen-independent coproporphyrinogen-3 oxidase
MSFETLAADPVSQLLTRLDVPGPRYTSYPTADRFVDSFGAADYRAALEQRARDAARGVAPQLSVYVHVPFCESVCYYCACNKIVTRQHSRAAPYLQALEREVQLHTDVLGRGQPISQLHLGGGSPTFLSDDELGEMLDMLRRAFDIAQDAEMSIEVDPRTVDGARLRAIAAMGFNRLSFGVQDIHPDVQNAVHRAQPFESVRDLMHEARAVGFESINVDLIYGLPLQTPTTFAHTVAQIGALRPDRIALYAYAHLPQRFKPQRRIHAHELPAAGDRVHMLRTAISGFQGLGYAHIGMDHFALPDDPLAIAKRQGRMHRNFQGYSTQADSDLIALGVSGIGRIGRSYSQNDKSMATWAESVEQGRFATVRGLRVSDEDLLRRDVIMALMCQGRVAYADIEAAHGVHFSQHFQGELERLRPFEQQQLVAIEPEAVHITALGWYFVRAIAMVFDAWLSQDVPRERYSRVV